METERKKQYSVIPVVLTACLLLFLLVGGFYFTRYLEKQIFQERTSQLVEVISQVRVNLNTALDSHWNYLTAAVNALEEESFTAEEDVERYVGKLEELLETGRYDSVLILLDSEGNCYDADGQQGVWGALDRISDGVERYTFTFDSYIYAGSYWAFVQKLDRPLHTQKDGITFTHVVLLKDVQSMSQYYDSAAYSGRNEVYILKSNGTRMHDDTQEKMIRSYNVLSALEDMDGQRYPDICAALEESGAVSANFFFEGAEYYYCVTSLERYDSLLLFLIPAQFVASDTVGMVNTLIRTLLLLAVLLLVLVVLAGIAFHRQRASATLFRQEQANLRRQEEMNVRLEESNAMLARAKETAEQAFQIAEDANRAKSAFLSSMSHDIRTPMNAIVGFASLLDRDADNPDRVREYTQKITASSQHLLGLINDILDISKIEAGKTTLNLSEESIVDLIEGIDGIIRPQMKAKGHTFEVYSRDLKHEHAVMDKLRLNQILLNLLSNAVKYTPEGGHVTLTVQELPQYAKQLAHYRFTVADNGYGMSEEYQRNLFQPFTREEDSVTSKIQGTGLGMAITKNLVDLMGGIISVKSEKGRGSTFTVELNLHISEQAIDLDFWKKNGITRILAVDDEEAVCRNIQLTMAGAGVTVDCALDGRSAVDMVFRAEGECRPYDVVLLDWKMPAMDGIEAARCIRQAAPQNRPILILTSYDRPEDGEDMDVDAFLAKPFFLTSFRQKVDAVLNHEPEQEPEEAGAASVLEGMHILAAEDNEINAEILSELLDMVGASCEICENGQAAVEAFERSAPGQYQLILMDIQMPVMDGYEAARAIRRLAHPLAGTIPIIAMTANAFAEDVQDALEAGMDAHVAKPVDMTMLEQTVKEVMEAQPFA